MDRRDGPNATGVTAAVRLPSSGRAQFHGRGAIQAGAGESGFDRPYRQRSIAGVRAARARARVALNPITSNEPSRNSPCSAACWPFAASERKGLDAIA